jgi:hypothetical protein
MNGKAPDLLRGRSGMFAGNIQEQTVISDQPVLVVDGEAILSSFSRLHDAELFLKHAKSDTALIFRHNGHNWDVCSNDALMPVS